MHFWLYLFCLQFSVASCMFTWNTQKTMKNPHQMNRSIRKKHMAGIWTSEWHSTTSGRVSSCLVMSSQSSRRDCRSILAPAGAVPGASETLPLCLCLEAAGSCRKLLEAAGGSSDATWKATWKATWNATWNAWNARLFNTVGGLSFPDGADFNCLPRTDWTNCSEIPYALPFHQAT